MGVDLSWASTVSMDVREHPTNPVDHGKVECRYIDLTQAGSIERGALGMFALELVFSNDGKLKTDCSIFSLVRYVPGL